MRAATSYLASMKTAARVALALSALTLLSGCQKQDDAAFGARVRAYLLEHPEVMREVAQKLSEKEQAEAAKASSEAIGKFRAQLERDPRDLVANPNGKVTVVEFYDYRCGYCKLAAPEVLELIRSQPDVRFVFKEYPIFGDVSDEAAKIALTPVAKAKGLQLHQAWMADKSLTQAGIDRHLTEAGIDPKVAREQAKDPAIERHLIETRQLAQNMHIEGTPAFIVGDTMIPGADMSALRAAILVAKAGDLKKG